MVLFFRNQPNLPFWSLIWKKINLYYRGALSLLSCNGITSDIAIGAVFIFLTFLSLLLSKNILLTIHTYTHSVYFMVKRIKLWMIFKEHGIQLEYLPTLHTYMKKLQVVILIKRIEYIELLRFPTLMKS